MRTLHPAALVREAPVSIEDVGDAHLVRRTRAGDEESFAELYRRYRSTVYEQCLRRLRDPVAADDVTQDTFLRAYSNLHRFDDARRLLPWLIAIATRRCIDVQRRGSRTETNDEIEDYTTDGSSSDPTLDAVVAGEERRRLERALRRLAPRQRRALLLHAVEGWSYADIAAAEGVSVASTKSLLFHARENLRRACRRGLLATILVPASGFRRRLRDLSEAARARFSSAAEPLVGAVAGSMAPSVAAMVMMLAALAPQTGPAIEASASHDHQLEILTAPAGSGSSGTISRLTSGALRRSTGNGSLAGALLNPTKDATPENTQITSVTPSPRYEEDRTLLAAGRVPCIRGSCMVLFVSRNGGGSWARQASENFTGHTVLLPPSYPKDDRIFAMGESGLQLSLDGGDSFNVVLPLQGDVAISPQFDQRDPRILVGATVVTEYWADRDLAKPATLIGPAGTWLTVAFSPAFAHDDTIFVGGIRPDTAGTMRPTVNRCAGSVCTNVVLTDGFDAPWLRPSPSFGQDETVYAFTSRALFRSVDGGTSFTSSSPSYTTKAGIRDLFVANERLVFVAAQKAATTGSGGGIYVSGDGGATWSGGRIAVRGFESGASRIVGLRDGRLIALGASSGIACSADGGRTWAPRCSG